MKLEENKAGLLGRWKIQIKNGLRNQRKNDKISWRGKEAFGRLASTIDMSTVDFVCT